MTKNGNKIYTIYNQTQARRRSSVHIEEIDDKDDIPLNTAPKKKVLCS
jgi:hypothetical protein